jgi:hypothetical protein
MSQKPSLVGARGHKRPISLNRLREEGGNYNTDCEIYTALFSRTPSLGRLMRSKCTAVLEDFSHMYN